MWEKIAAIFSKDIINLVREGFVSLSKMISNWWKARKERKRFKGEIKDIKKDHKRRYNDYKDDNSTRNNVP